ncbi:hypothetical protein PUN28_020486 [Cardiocondyla obscurior]|uniref:Uncharacterized protein n=1 Tax=Cardiocondyla obscurior TaxID=286306 RepID=A0AAW2E6A5_9HYME
MPEEQLQEKVWTSSKKRPEYRKELWGGTAPAQVEGARSISDATAMVFAAEYSPPFLSLHGYSANWEVQKAVETMNALFSLSEVQV